MECRGFVAAVVFGCVLQLPFGEASAQVVTSVESRYVAADYSRLIAASQADQGQLMLRFQLIEASSRPATATRDPAIASVDTVLRDLFRYSSYRLISEAAIAATADGGNSSLILNGGGETYQLDVSVMSPPISRGGRDAAMAPQPPAIQMRVTLKTVPAFSDAMNQGGGGQQGGRAQGAVKMAGEPERPVVAGPTPSRTVLFTTVTISPGRTVVLGSTQPGGPDRALILVMKPEVRKY